MLSLLLTSVLSFYHVQVPMAPMRQAPGIQSEVVSQAVFAEEVKILETDGDWVKIQTVDDSYSGWTKSDAVIGRERIYADCVCVTPIVEVNRLAAHVYDRQSTLYGPIFTLPFESRLEALDPFEEPDSPWIAIRLPDETPAFIQRGDVTTDIHAILKDELAAFSKHFLNLPFTHGGRSSFGYDSAGFIQMLYKQIGSTLPRHVQKQFNWEGFEAVSINALEPGDLIFWGPSENNIQHVGMSLGHNQFIHTTPKENQPWVRISDLDAPLYKGVQEWKFRAGKRLR
jgi:hypothetical protein